MLLLAVTVLLSGLGFKLSLVPFHAWTPQAYCRRRRSAPLLPRRGVKISALAALLVVVQAVGAAVDTGSARIVVAVLAGAASMLLGNVMALRQDDVDPAARLVDRVAGRLGRAAAWPRCASGPAGLRRLRARVRRGHPGRLRRGDGRGGRRRPLRAAPAACSAPRPARPVGRWRFALLVLAGLPPGIIGLVAQGRGAAPGRGRGLWLAGPGRRGGVVLGIAVYLRWFALLLLRAGTGGGPGEAMAERRYRHAAPAVDPRSGTHPSHLVAPRTGARPRCSCSAPASSCCSACSRGCSWACCPTERTHHPPSLRQTCTSTTTG